VHTAAICRLPAVPPHPVLSPPHLIPRLMSSHHLSSTSSIIGGTAYGQNITTATTGKYLHTLALASLLSPIIPSLPIHSPFKFYHKNGEMGCLTYIIALPPTFFHCAAHPGPAAAPALAARTAAYVLNCWIAGRWIRVRARAESTGLRARGDIVSTVDVEWRLWAGIYFGVGL
jgi:hypothetical protein